ncbi:MAG: hypothetical protein CM1200mP2_58250 [Planctomycetaceae bacterium]|nr:MAG: hypothetical protein CM1200mP2_58250 [Planctomycetaceae bacterium]
MAATHTPPASDGHLIVDSRVSIPLTEFDFEYMRSSGPGGQKVNKTSTKVRLRWSVVDSPSIDEALRQRVGETFRTRITADGEFLVTSQRTRDREANRSDCLEKLAEMIPQVSAPPRKRRPTRPTRASKERRLKQKKQRSRRKQMRAGRETGNRLSFLGVMPVNRSCRDDAVSGIVRPLMQPVPGGSGHDRLANDSSVDHRSCGLPGRFRDGPLGFETRGHAAQRRLAGGPAFGRLGARSECVGGTVWVVAGDGRIRRAIHDRCSTATGAESSVFPRCGAGRESAGTIVGNGCWRANQKLRKGPPRRRRLSF